MVQNQGIDVYLAPYGHINERYEQHAVPLGSPAFTNDPNEVYIEAVDGERFMIVADLLKDFDMKGATHLYFTYKIDQPVGGSATGLCSSLSDLRAGKPTGTNLQGRDTLSELTKKVNGNWCDCALTFASLEIDEELSMTADEVAKDSERHGKIMVTVERGKLVKIGRCKKGDALWDYYEPPDTKISSKEVVKDNRVSHAVGYVVIGEGTQPVKTVDKRHSKWTPLKDDKGILMKFAIRYRSRDALQKLKIIPKDIYPHTIDLTESPPPSPRVKLERGIDGVKQEDKDTATDAKIKRESGGDDSNAHSLVGPEQALRMAISENEPNPLGPAHDERNKKRKALQDEFDAIELQQKKMRVVQALADLDNGN